MGAAISLQGIEEAARVIDPAFRDSPQFVSEPLSDRLGVTTILKVESVNPIRCFKGRGTDYLLHRIGDHHVRFVCASAGNFGQGMAYAARARGVELTVFAASGANALKVERMRALGARVVLEGADFDSAKEVARRHAASTGAFYVEDGLLPPIAEGAGTMAIELGRMREALDAIMVPLGNGSLVNGVGTWFKHSFPATRVIAVCADGAPAMELSWRAGKPVATDSSDTIADGIAVRVPVPEALDAMRGRVDEVMLVSDAEILAAMRVLLVDAGLAVEPAGASGLAALVKRRAELAGARVAVVVTGGNLTEDQFRTWFSGSI